MFKKTKEKFHDRTKDSINNISSLRKLISYRFKNIFRDRKFNQENLENDFNLVLEKWGLESEQIPQVCKDLKGRIFLHGLVFFIGTLLLFQGYLFLGVLLCFCSFIGISTAKWRIFVLQKQQFISFSKYSSLIFR